MRTRAIVCFVGLLLAGCGGGGGGAAPPPPPPPAPLVPATLTGSVEVTFPRVEQVLESEPNDALDQAHYLGELTPGRRITVVGRADDVDLLDGFRLLADARVKVSVALEFDAAAADLDAGVWDVAGSQYVELFASGASPEEGTFYAKGALDVVVAAASGGADYLLTIAVEAAEPKVPTREPDDFFYSGRYLGEILPGDFVVCSGTIHQATDAFDSVIVSCPVAVRLRVRLSTPLTGLPSSAVFDAIVHDLTGGASDPPELAYFLDTGDVAAGTLDLPAGSLVQVFAYAYEGAATFDLVLDGLAYQGAAAAAAIAPRAGARFPPPAFPAEAFEAYGRPSGTFARGEAIVLARRGGEGDLARDGCRVLARVPDGPALVEVPLPPGCDEEEGARGTLRAIGGLARHASVAYAEPNRVRHAFANPDDEFANLQWHYALVNLPAAWDISTGSDDVVVAVLDTGQTNHPDLAGRQVAGYDFISNASSARDGDGIDPDPTDPGDLLFGSLSSFHGTHVAGTLGAATNNGVGVAGVTWAARLMHLRVLGRFGGTDFDIANAIRYAAGLPNASGTVPARRAHVVNMSLGGPGSSQTLQDAATAARNAGVVLVAAAGNAGTSEPNVPASLAGVVSVSAVDADARRAYYSSYGGTIDIAAPGGDMRVDRNGDGWPDGVLSTQRFDDVSPPEDAYAFSQGTSMACPHVAGVAALIFAVDPTLTPDEVEHFLFSTAADIGVPGKDDLYGWGLVDARAALVAVQASNAPPVPPALGLSTTSMIFQPGETARRVAVSNVGGGRLLVGDPLVTTQTGAPWLFAVRVANSVSDAPSDTTAIDVSVNPVGLDDGLYSGLVTLASNGGTRAVQVLLRVSNAPDVPPDVRIHVRVVNADTGAVAAQAIVNPATTLEFTLAGVPPGRYRLEAGSDDDNDGVFFEANELSGVYPVRSAPVLIPVQSGDRRGPFRFSVGPEGAGIGR